MHQHPYRHMNLKDTICAICTPPGRGAIATLRLSGPDAIAIADKVFASPKQGKRLADQKAMTLHYGSLRNQSGEAIDDVVVALFRAPHSFTGEDTVEFSCHGSTLIQRQALQALIDAGARMATAGEFTKRAFVDGKMDLSQAEAVADMIASDSEAARRVAYDQLRGGFSRQLADLREQLLQFTSLIELELDFSEEDVEFADRQKFSDLVGHILGVITRLADSFRLGNAIKQGIPTAIVGAPNVGKSTLLNALLCEDRSIVSDIMGTTRDTIEETLSIGDLSFRLIDTAGIRDTADVIEAEGVKRSQAAVAKAMIVILMVDAQEGEEAAAKSVSEIHRLMRQNDQSLIVCVNKTDAAAADWANDDWRRSVAAHAVVRMSARDGVGVDTLSSAMVSAVNDGGSVVGEDVVVTNARHYEALTTAREALLRVRSGLDSGMGGEILSLDVREATDALASITGQVTSQDVLNNIFAHFCIGK